MMKYSLYILLFSLLFRFIFKILPKKEIYKFIESSNDLKSIVILELNNYHLECLPGFTKYFVDLGYNVDILIRKKNRESMEKFEPKNKIRIFEFTNINQIEHFYGRLKKKLNKYKYSLLHTTDFQEEKKKIYKNLGYYDNPNSLFIVHGMDFLEDLNITKFVLKNHTFSLADYGKLIFVNPHYFGEFNLTQKRKKIKNKTSFFITSSGFKNYSYLIEAVENLHNKSINFEMHVPGHVRDLNEEILPKHLRKYFHFYGHVNYQKLYQIVLDSDFIIINLFPDLEFDNLFRTYRATGNAQLIYGFLKPGIIEEHFAHIYKFTNKNSIIFQYHNLSSAIENATQISDEQYYQMTMKIQLLRDNIYNISLNNLKNALS